MRKFHGHSPEGATSGTYNSWRAMLERCGNPNNSKYADYGGRGIKVCERWLLFINFLEDMGERPDGFTLDRIRNDGHYEQGNCRWATWKQQANNRRKRAANTYAKGETCGQTKLSETQVLTILSGGKSDAQFGRDFGVIAETVRQIRLRRTWRHIHV